MTNRAASKTVFSISENGGIPVKTSLTKCDLINSNFNQAENKTGTNFTADFDQPAGAPKTLAADLRIDRVWREVVDFGEPSSGTGEEGWGRKRVSVARVSILDGPCGQNDPLPDD